MRVLIMDDFDSFPQHLGERVRRCVPDAHVTYASSRGVVDDLVFHQLSQVHGAFFDAMFVGDISGLDERDVTRLVGKLRAQHPRQTIVAMSDMISMRDAQFQAGANHCYEKGYVLEHVPDILGVAPPLTDISTDADVSRVRAWSAHERSHAPASVQEVSSGIAATSMTVTHATIEIVREPEEEACDAPLASVTSLMDVGGVGDDEPEDDAHDNALLQKELYGDLPDLTLEFVQTQWDELKAAQAQLALLEKRLSYQAQSLERREREAKAREEGNHRDEAALEKRWSELGERVREYDRDQAELDARFVDVERREEGFRLRSFLWGLLGGVCFSLAVMGGVAFINPAHAVIVPR